MKVEEIITNQILEYLKEGEIPWKQPWMSIFPKNFANNNEYSGINFFLLSIITKKNKWKYPFFLTYKQAKDLGGVVKKGQKGTVIVFSKVWTPKNQRINENDIEKKAKDSYWLLRYYRVFNIDQCEGIKAPELSQTAPDVSYEDILKSYIDIPIINKTGNRAYYNPLKDEIGIPPTNQFKDTLDYYSTLYHELTHSTGAKKRLGRFEENETGIFGSESYSKEELIAELGSAFLCARHNIDNRLIKNSAGYIQNWLKALENNPRWIISASSKAQKAVNYMTGKKGVIKKTP